MAVHDNRDYFSDPDGLDEAINRHIRRGIREIRTSWRENFDFYDYLLQEMYFDRGSAGSGDEAVETEGNRLRERLARTIGQLGIGAEIISQDNGPRLTRFTLELHGLDDLDRLRRGIDKVAFALGLGEDTITSGLALGERRVSVDIPRPMATWRTITWNDVKESLAGPAGVQLQMPVCIGTDVLGAAYLFDLSDAPHLFVGGTTGSGKSMCVHAILLSLLRPGSSVELVLIDPKGVEFSGYEGSTRVRGGTAIADMDAAIKVLNGLVEEMGERQEKLRSLDARNITEANERGAALNRVVVVIDELGDLFSTHREVETPLIRLAQKARSAGIHLVLATQRPEAATFPGLLRSNIPSRIALTVQKAAESRIILDETGAEALHMRGDMLVRFAGRQTTRAHGCLIEPVDIIEAARAK